jgi:FecR protein
MIENSAHNSRLSELIDRVVDNTATADSIRELEVLLREDRAARRYYRRVLELHAGLRWMHRVPRPDIASTAQPPATSWANGHDAGVSQGGISQGGINGNAGINACRLDLESPGCPNENLTSCDGLRGATSPIAATPNTALQNTAPRNAALPKGVTFLGSPAASFLSGNRVLGFGLFASVIILALFFVYPRDPQPNDAGTPPPALAAAQPVTVFRLDSGTAEVALANTGLIVLQGPAEFELLSPTRARLVTGRIRVRITEKSARGFVVETPNGEVTDLGTEFGLDASSGKETGVVVFEGAVDLRVTAKRKSGAPLRFEHLVQGDGVIVNDRGDLRRFMSLAASDLPTFGKPSVPADNYRPVITKVRDNLRTSDTKRYYEIVPRGMREDALAYVDRREHEWNGLDARGMPAYLIGADYIKPFNNDKLRRDVEITVTLGRPARLFVLFDVRLPVPAWLSKSFRNTGDKLGLDVGPFYDDQRKVFIDNPRGIGPGKDVEDPVCVWERIVTEPGEIKLGANETETIYSAMYGIAAIPLEAERK